MKILLAEDDALIGKNIQNALLFYGYEVIGPISTGREAIEKFQEHQPDLAILDVELKDDVNGLQVAEKIKQRDPIPIIFITGLLHDEIRERAKQLNAFAFINKPFHERNLFNAIDMALSDFSRKGEQIPEKAEIIQTPVIKIKERFYIKKNDKYVRIEVSDVLFLEASGHYIIIQLENEQVLASSNISAFLEQLNHPDLVRVHRSYAVNMHNVPDFDDTFIYYGQKAVPISKGYKEAFKERLNTI